MSLDYKIILCGVPAYSSRGFLGWCTISLILKDGKKILFDTGSYGDRRLLLDTLKRLNISKEDIDIVFLSHLHYDHSVNAELFNKSKILTSQKEIEYFTSGKYKEMGDIFVPESIIRSIEDKLEGVRNGDEILEGITVIELPGHTPGSVGLLMNDVIFTGDALKNAWEFVRNVPPKPIFGDKKKAIKNYETIREIANIVVPGHDRPFRLLENNKVKYLVESPVVVSTYRDPIKDEGQEIQF